MRTLNNIIDKQLEDVRKETIQECIDVKMDFPKGIADPLSLELFERGVEAKEEAIRKLLDEKDFSCES